MADEPRRSGRATKGQHTKNDTPEPAQKKGKGRKKAQKEDLEPEPEDETPAEIIRCVCGYVVEDPKDKRAMICCDNCNAWQHNVHVGISEEEDEQPDSYFCEQCKPENHKELLDAMARGEKLWETREIEAKAAKLATRKKGKGGRKSAATEKERISNSAGPPSIPSSTPQPDAKQETGTKRKLPNETPTESPAAENVSLSSNCFALPTSNIYPGRQQDEEGVDTKATSAPTIDSKHCRREQTRLASCWHYPASRTGGEN